MGIKCITPTSEIDAYLAEQARRIEQRILYNLSYVGEQCVNKARESGSYTDRTGNLRSSTGYVIVKDGQIVQTGGFTTVGNGKEGAEDGNTFARQLANDFPDGIVLIVVAGMKYASYVSAKGYDVLDSAELLAQRTVPKIMKQLNIR